jgi:hypothetical protein
VLRSNRFRFMLITVLSEVGFKLAHFLETGDAAEQPT